MIWKKTYLASKVIQFADYTKLIIKVTNETDK